MSNYSELFDKDRMSELFPASRTDAFFEALFGDAEEGSYDIELVFIGERGSDFDFEFRLLQRPGRCLACNLTYGLPQVFSRHPIINVQGVADAIAVLLGKDTPSGWQLGSTKEYSGQVHAIPLTVSFE